MSNPAFEIMLKYLGIVNALSVSVFLSHQELRGELVGFQENLARCNWEEGSLEQSHFEAASRFKRISRILQKLPGAFDFEVRNALYEFHSTFNFSRRTLC